MPETSAETIEYESRPARPADTLHEHILSALARGREIYTGWRQRRLVGTQICVTGSCGKSTAVRLISHMLAGEGTLDVLTHPNNDKHLLRPHRRRRQPVDFVVQEVSGYAPGAIAPLARSLRVDIAVITSVGTDHETSYRPSRIGMTMLEGVAREKGRLAAAVHVGGTVCLSADDPHVAGMAGRCRGRVVTFGTAESADFRAINIELDWPQRIQFDLVPKAASIRWWPILPRVSCCQALSAP